MFMLRQFAKKLCHYVLGALVVWLVRAIRLFYPLRIDHLNDDRIGHLVGNVDLYLRRRQLDPKAAERAFFITRSPCNETIVELYRQQVPIVKSRFLSWLFWVTKPALARAGLYKPVLMYTNEYKEFAQVPAQISFSPEQERRGQDALRAMGIGPDDWFVCFHARDPAYLKDYRKNSAYHDFRDSDILNCIAAMRRVTARGGFAIRMGAIVEKELGNLNDPKIVDYATRWRDDFLDVYLCAKSKFFIGNTSGLFHIAKAFGVPYAMANLIGYLHMSPQPNSLFMPKLLRGTESNALLTFPEMASLGLFDAAKGLYAYFTDYYFKNALEPIENSSDEMADLTDDMFDLAEGRNPPPDIVVLQNKFKDLYFGQSSDRDDAGNLAPSFLKRHEAILFSHQV
jgi:putative glycosyltransferase (TIGR04372 family)